MKTLGAFITLAFLTACASPDYVQYAKSVEASSVARSQALAEIAKSGDATAKVAAVMALALGQGAGSQTSIQAPQASEALQWASILVPGLTQMTGMRYNYLSQQTQSNNATALGISTNNTFAGLAGKIQSAGSVTNNTLSGTGTLGSGAYSTQDRHDVTSPAPVVITPVTQIVPTVITPVTQIVPTVITPITPIVPVTPTVPIVITPITPIVPTVITPITPIVPTVIVPTVITPVIPTVPVVITPVVTPPVTR